MHARIQKKKFHEKGGGVELGYNLSFRGGGGVRGNIIGLRKKYKKFEFSGGEGSRLNSPSTL